MRDYSKEFADRVQYIRKLVADSGVDGIVFGNSGGKDSALVGILCKFACENTVGIMMPCASKRNFHKVVLDVKKLDALGIFLEISHGILSAFCAPIYVKFETYVTRIGILNKILPHQLVAVLELLKFVRMVVITECKTVFLCKFSHTVEIFAHAFHAGYGIIYLIARNYEIFSAACFLYFEQFAPTVHDFLLF